MQPTNPLLRALRKYKLTTKTVSSNYYKGNRTGRMGDHTKYGGYRVDYKLVRTFVVPVGLKEFEMTPFVTRKLMVKSGRKEDNTAIPDGETYLAAWKDAGGYD